MVVSVVGTGSMVGWIDSEKRWKELMLTTGIEQEMNGR